MYTKKLTFSSGTGDGRFHRSRQTKQYISRVKDWSSRRLGSRTKTETCVGPGSISVKLEKRERKKRGEVYQGLHVEQFGVETKTWAGPGSVGLRVSRSRPRSRRRRFPCPQSGSLRPHPSHTRTLSVFHTPQTNGLLGESVQKVTTTADLCLTLL